LEEEDGLEDGSEEAVEDGRWALMSGTEITPPPRLCNLLKDAATGKPFIMASEDLPSGWSTTEGQVYHLSADWVDKLNRAAEVALGAIDLHSEHSDGEYSDGEHSDGDNSNSDGEEGHKGAEAAAKRHDELRQTSLVEAFATTSSTRRPVSGEERQVRLSQINVTLNAYRDKVLQETGNDMMSSSSSDWPLSLRRLLKESHSLQRSLQSEG
jgi:hypothetical protein